MTLNIDEMPTHELKNMMKMLVRNLNDAHERIDALQERVLEVEKKINY